MSFKRTLKKVFWNWKMMVLVLTLLLSIIAIHPAPWREGVAIRNVEKNSSAAEAGLLSVNPKTPPMSREVIVAIDDYKIRNLEEYYSVLSKLEPGTTATVKTNKKNGLYKVKIRQDFDGKVDLGVDVYDAPTTNLKKGLDLQGGTRVLLEPERELTADEMSLLIENLHQRLNLYGLSDIVVSETGDLSGNQYVLIEIAGSNKEEIKSLVSSQGKFEAKIGPDVMFSGGEDIKYVCRTADCSGIDPREGCGQVADGTSMCRFMFSITLSKESAERQAARTKDMLIITQGRSQYLNETLDLYLDGEIVENLSIVSDLRGKDVTGIAITGSGVGQNFEEAKLDALKSMKKLQTVLATGQLPAKLEIVKTDNISPILGKDFIKNAMLIALVSILVVSLILFISYRKLKIAIPITVVMISEVIILLGVAALIGWNLDMAAIAGIIVAVGTGIDDQ
ncbi:MAG: PDZ domain-containing protein, partial [Nanoarchaeota archaeon]|nr:PDZ domain-containing protein [Nanoarchaeota archaeon]